jgi:ATP-dependent DNA helicase RecG
MGKVERMGSGIERMRDLMREAGLKEPVFEMDAFFRVTFYRDPRYSLKAEKLQKGIEKTTQKIPRKYPEELTGNQLNLLALLEKDGSLTREQLAEKLNISPETVKKNLANLKYKKLINRIGPDKGGHWEIVNV